MDWTQALTVIGVLGTFMLWIFNKLDADIKAQGNRIDEQGKRTDEQMKRIDKLYQMFVDLLNKR